MNSMVVEDGVIVIDIPSCSEKYPREKPLMIEEQLEFSGYKCFDPNIITNIEWGEYVLDPNGDPNFPIEYIWSSLDKIFLYPPTFLPLDPNIDPNTFPDPNYVPPEYLDLNDIFSTNPIFAKITIQLEEPPDSSILGKYTIARLESKDDVEYIWIDIPILIIYNEYDPNTMELTGITQPIIPLLWWPLTDWIWTVGYVENRVVISHLYYGHLGLSYPMIKGDFNGDGIVNMNDLMILCYCWGGNNMMGDLNLDGLINLRDFSIFCYNYNR